MTGHLSRRSLQSLAAVAELLQTLPPGRYRALFTVAKLRQPRNVEYIEGLVQRAFDVTVRKPRALTGRLRSLP